jgi:formiminotetrahydrofolate cyclodeaminase
VTEPERAWAALPIGAFVDALGSDRATPGSGAAAAVCLSLAGGCLAKAAAVTLKHAPSAPLARLLEEARLLSAAALAGADEETEAFRALLSGLRQGRPADAASAVVEVSDGLITCADALEELAQQMARLVDPVVAADLPAAQALLAAGREILDANRREAARTAP